MRDIDQIIAALRRIHPEISVRQFEVTHPGDDDGIWFFTHPGRGEEVQLESSTGALPFLVESNQAPPHTVQTIGDAVALVSSLLELP